MTKHTRPAEVIRAKAHNRAIWAKAAKAANMDGFEFYKAAMRGQVKTPKGLIS